MLGNNLGWNHYYRGEPPLEQLVCVMPKKYYDRVIALHQNCCGVLEEKRKGMMDLGPLNWTYDEERYDEEAKGTRHLWGNADIPERDIHPVVEPDW